jgi:hypothetical protein
MKIILMLIHTYHAVPLPCHAAEGLDYIFPIWFTYIFPIWFTQCDCVWFTLAMPRPCRSERDFSTARRGMGMARHCELGSAVQRRHVGDLYPRSASSSYRAEFHEGCNQKYTNSFNCRTSNSNISGYHVDFHKEHGTVGEWQGRHIICVN